MQESTSNVEIKIESFEMPQEIGHHRDARPWSNVDTHEDEENSQSASEASG